MCGRLEALRSAIMRRVALAIGSIAVLALCVYLQADGPKKDGDLESVRVQLQDAESGKPIAGIVRVFHVGQEKPIALPGLYDRLCGLKESPTLTGWHVVPVDGGTTMLPRGKIRVEAVSGLESVRA